MRATDHVISQAGRSVVRASPSRLFGMFEDWDGETDGRKTREYQCNRDPLR